MRVFLDANILISAAFPRSLLARFLDDLGSHATLITNEYARTEAERNITATRMPATPAHAAFLASLDLVPFGHIDLNCDLAEKDRPILIGAIAGRADFLLTGDKRDFGHLFGKTIHGVKIVTVALLLAELRARGIIQS